jgi:hypothetical protein
MWTNVSRAGFKGYNLRAAGGAVEHPVWQVAHLWMPTLAGVLAQSVGKGGYLLKGSQDGVHNGAAARVAADQDAIG